MLRGARSAALAARPLVAAAAAAGLCAASSVAACAQPKPCATEATIRGKRVPVTADPGADACVATRSVVFQDWADSLPDGLDVESVHVQSVDLFGKPPKQRLGFVKFSASVKVDGHPAPGIVFMRGGAVCVLMVLESEGREYALVTRQPRVPIASSGFDEIPAGMLDGSGAFAGEACAASRRCDCGGSDRSHCFAFWASTPATVAAEERARLVLSCSVLPSSTAALCAPAESSNLAAHAA